MQPAILLTKTKAAEDPEKQVASTVSLSSKATPNLPSYQENQTESKAMSQSWQLNSQKTLEKETSQRKEAADLSFLTVNNKLGEKQLFVDLGNFKINNSHTNVCHYPFQKCVRTWSCYGLNRTAGGLLKVY